MNVTEQLMEQARLEIDDKHRPTIIAMELVGQYLATAQRQHKSYCDESHNQIREGLHKVLTLDQVKVALRALDYPGLWQIVKPGGKNAPTRRVLSSYDRDGLIATQGDKPHHDDEQSQGDKSTSQGDKSTNAVGLEHHHSGTNPTTPKPLPKDLPNYSPRYPAMNNAQAL
jgi:hypothetical protein